MKAIYFWMLFLPVWMLMGQAEAMSHARPIILAEVKMKDATLEEAVLCIKAAAGKLTQFGPNHLNVVILGSSPYSNKRISLDLKNIPLKDVLEHVAQTMGMRMRIETHAVVLAAALSPEPIHTCTYRVPPDFISTGSAAK